MKPRGRFYSRQRRKKRGVGVGRGLVGHRNVVLTALETLGIATAAALAGFLIGKLVTR
jgi:hypothetical protein